MASWCSCSNSSITLAYVLRVTLGSRWPIHLETVMISVLLTPKCHEPKNFRRSCVFKLKPNLSTTGLKCLFLKLL